MSVPLLNHQNIQSGLYFLEFTGQAGEAGIL